MAKREFSGVDIKVEFNETANRQQISSGDKINTLFGKIRKWLSDLKPIAFSGSYDDLSNKPESLPANGGIAQTISDVLPISKGGTGQITAQKAFDALVNGLNIGSDTAVLNDNDYYISQYANGNDTSVNKQTYNRRKLLTLWKYIKTKSDSIYYTQTEAEELKKSVSDGKKMVADAITEKGVTTAADAVFATMATNIGKIVTGDNIHLWENTANGTYKFVQQGARWVANNRGVNSSTASSTWKVTLSKATNYNIGWRISTETNYDKLTITLNGVTIVNSASGVRTSEQYNSLTLQAGENTIVATYTKDGSNSSFGDMAYIILLPVTEVAQPISQYKYQTKSVTPGTSAQTVYPDMGYDGLSSVSVSAASGSGNVTKSLRFIANYGYQSCVDISDFSTIYFSLKPTVLYGLTTIPTLGTSWNGTGTNILSSVVSSGDPSYPYKVSVSSYKAIRFQRTGGSTPTYVYMKGT